MAGRLELVEYAVLAVRAAVQEGADEAEAYASRTRGSAVELKNNNMGLASSFDEAGVGIRVVVGGRLGFSYTSDLSRRAIEEAARMAVGLARASKPDPDWRGLPDPSASYPVVEKVFDPSLARMPVDRVSEKAVEMLDAALEDKRITVVDGGVEVGVEERAVANTSGVYRSGRGTYAHASIEVVAGDGGDVTPSCYSWRSSRIGLPDTGRVVREAVEMALTSLHPARPEQGSMPVIFTEKALFMLFLHTVLQAVKGDNVARGRSPYAGRLGEKVASDNFTLIDDGVMPGGLGTWSFDGEGVAAARTMIIEKGVLRGFLYDSYWARRMGVESTGNAVRRGYASLPRISFTNLVVEAGDASTQEMLAETRRGLLVDFLQGAHSSNPETGEFSVVATPAWLVENGELRPVRGVMLAGNIYELLSSIDMVGKELRAAGNFYAPWIRFSSVRVVSK